MDGLVAGGIEVTRVPLEVASTEHSQPYLHTKADKMGHMLSEFSTKRDAESKLPQFSSDTDQR
jgi:hypothetical protein